jgi:hypothetical protein
VDRLSHPRVGSSYDNWLELMGESQGLLQMAAEHILDMQKSLCLMSVPIHHVLSDITELSGLAIPDAIRAGERDCVKLAQALPAILL